MFRKLALGLVAAASLSAAALAPTAASAKPFGRLGLAAGASIITTMASASALSARLLPSALPKAAT